MGRKEHRSRARSRGCTAAPGAERTPIPAPSDIGEMLVKGELDACVHYITDANLVDRSRVEVGDAIRYLWPDRDAESARYYKKTGIYPINHIMVIKRELYERHPWVTLNLYSAFVK